MNADTLVVESSLYIPNAAVSIQDLPCGYLDDQGVLHREVQVRAMTGFEEELLGNDKIPGMKKFNQLLVNCLVRIGQIDEKAKIASIVPKLLVGDRVFLFLQIRRVTIGDTLPFRSTCPVKSCRKESRHLVNLGDLPVQVMQDARKRSFTATLPVSKQAVQYRCANGEDEERAEKFEDRVEAASLILLQRIEQLDGKPPTLGDLQAMHWVDREFLREAFDKGEGGLDTSIDLECSHCGHQYRKEVPVGQAGFFYPRTLSL